MHVTKIKTGKYRCREMQQGERFSVTVIAASKKEAEKFARAIFKQKQTRITRSEITVQDAFIKWEQTEMPTSMKSHAAACATYAQNSLLASMDDVASQYRDELLDEGYSKCTINNRLACFKRVGTLAYKRWKTDEGSYYLEHPIHQRIEKVSTVGTERDVFLSPTEFKQLLEAIDNEESRWFFITVLYSGMRVWTRVFTLLPSQIRNEMIVPHATQAVNKRTGSVPIPSDLADKLLEILPWRAKATRFRKDFEKAREKCGHPEWRIHDLRHTFGTWLVSNPNVALTTVRDLLSHSNLATTSRYLHTTEQQMREATDKLPKVY